MPCDELSARGDRTGVRAWALALLMGGFCAPGRAQYVEDYGRTAGLSRTMQMAIRYYDEGRDSEAMDHFMEVLSGGDPSERSMANEYLNLITQRMYSGSSLHPKPDIKPPVPATLLEPSERPGAAPAMREPLEVRTRPFYGLPERLPGRTEAEQPPASKAVMKKEIEGKLKALARSFVSELEAYQDIRVLMADRDHVRALGVPTDLLFENGIVFKKKAGKLLESLTGLTYCLGATQVAILPEGATIGDAKILDMRRTMGVAAHLYAAGIAPPRVRVNLLSSQIDLPRAMADFRGIIVLFTYNQPLTLAADVSLGDEGGPPISLGVWPDRFRADRGEGSVMEFSVVEPPAGLLSWKFQLRHPASGPGSDLVPVQEVVGVTPVFHQIYWNGRKNFFGPELAPGRYEVVLSATDGKNRTRRLHRWISLEGEAPAPKAPPAASPAPVKLEKRAPVDFVQIKKPVPAAKAKARVRSPVLAKKKRPARPHLVKASRKEEAPLAAAAPARPAPAQPAAAAPTQPAAAPAAGAGATPPAAPAAGAGATPPAAATGVGGTLSYRIPFTKGTQQMGAEGERTIGQIVDSLQIYPLENVNLVGYASQSEPDAEKLAQQRANTISTLLVNRYTVDPRRIQIQSKVVPEETCEVQVFTVRAKE